jgi:membrane protease YdiL (CAAX protease family)
MRIIDWHRRHELVTYFLLTFVISWGAVLAVILPTTGFPAPAEAFSTQGNVFAASVFALLLGPPIASLAMTAFVGGKPTLRELRRGLRRARVPARYYAVALIAPASLTAVLAALSAVDDAYRPGILTASAPAIAVGLIYALAAGFFEELGWTGFATPRLIARYGRTRGALVLGVIWVIWHVLPVYTFTAETYGALYIASFVQSLVFLTSFRVIMTTVYERTGSVLVSQVLHFGLTAASILIAPATTPAKMMIWNSLWPLTLAIVATVMVGASRITSASGRHPSPASSGRNTRPGTTRARETPRLAR